MREAKPTVVPRLPRSISTCHAAVQIWLEMGWGRVNCGKEGQVVRHNTNHGADVVGINLFISVALGFCQELGVGPYPSTQRQFITV